MWPSMTETDSAGETPAGVVDAFQLEALDLGIGEVLVLEADRNVRPEPGRDGRQPARRIEGRERGAADVVVDVVVEIGRLEPQAVIGGWKMPSRL